jgi:hypothetical protein
MKQGLEPNVISLGESPFELRQPNLRTRHNGFCFRQLVLPTYRIARRIKRSNTSVEPRKRGPRAISSAQPDLQIRARCGRCTRPRVIDFLQRECGKGLLETHDQRQSRRGYSHIQLV